LLRRLICVGLQWAGHVSVTRKSKYGIKIVIERPLEFSYHYTLTHNTHNCSRYRRMNGFASV
jgi:hypothetical protein